MPGFIHGKNARIWMDQYELTSYFNEFTFGARAGIAETTVFGKGAKTYIGGLLEGQITARGFFDDSTSGNDQELASVLGSATNTAITFVPSGIAQVGTRAMVSEAAETDYSITAPVNNVVGVTATWQADSGLKTGVQLLSPTVAYSTIGTNAPATTVAIGSNGVNTTTYAGAGTLNVASTTGFPTAGMLTVSTSSGPFATLSYTGTTGTTFTGVNNVYGGGPIATGGNVTLSVNDRQVASGTVSSNGLVAVAHILTLTGTGSPTVLVKIQHSDDNASWADLVTLTPGPSGTTTQSVADGLYGTVPVGTSINRYLRAVVVGAGTTLSTTVLVSAARL